ncbi:MAG: UvrD-helicase domain-containing protein, partial [Pseudomonadales bacterium]|nr:UvrD-helicase domain-containing protein [Pseudomonadales bacterium]
MDGRGEDGPGSIDLRQLDRDRVSVKLNRDWPALLETARRRRSAAEVLLQHLREQLKPGVQGADLLVETTLSKLLKAIESDLELRSWAKDPRRLLDRALLWLHEQEVIRLNKGLAVFRPAMTIRVEKTRRRFGRTDFAPLELHYQEQVLQIHVMEEFVNRGLDAIAAALQLAMDYFALDRDTFLERWLPDREDLARQTTPESWRAIVESLNNPTQRRIVADDREQTNVLVLAGPGSGKTRVLVHRIAYLLRVRREDPRSILALAYNRHAAVEIRRRLDELVGADSRGVTVLTCHGMALRLTGTHLADRPALADDDFRELLREATVLLRGEGLESDEADEQRERLLAGFRWILVDEYQDVDEEQYQLISALAGRTLTGGERKLTLFAVGDDDQNIYAYAGASVKYLRRFEEDYKASTVYLTQNYRSTGHIIAAANAWIESARERMKAEHPIVIDRSRRRKPKGGDWESRDAVGRGRVQILRVRGDGRSQAMAALAELRRLADLDPDWDWRTSAVIARNWRYLDPLRSLCERDAIPVQM